MAFKPLLFLFHIRKYNLKSSSNLSKLQSYELAEPEFESHSR